MLADSRMISGRRLEQEIITHEQTTVIRAETDLISGIPCPSARPSWARIVTDGSRNKEVGDCQASVASLDLLAVLIFLP